MVSVAVSADQNPSPNAPCTVVAPSAIVILLAGMIAAWFAAGSTGLLAHSLQHALTWVALAVALVAAWPRNNHSFGTWAILVGGVLLGMFFTTSALPTVNVLAVTLVLAAIAQVSRGLTGRVALIASFAAGALALCRFACDSIPTVWLIADLKGWLLGRLAGWLAGNPLEIGATFGGLDFLVLMAAVYAAWLVCTAPPRYPRAVWVAVAILLAHIAYLIVLAQSENLLAALPDMVVPPESDTSHVGLWTWSNGLRMLLPWNVPLLAVMLNSAIAAAMFRAASWFPVIEPDPKQLKKQQEKEEKEEVPGSVLAMDMLFRFGPVLLAVSATLLVGLAVNKSDLKGKTVVAYAKGYLNWLKPEYDSPVNGSYGMLRPFVESLGGKFTISKELSEHDLSECDVLVLIHPDEPWSDETLDRVWDYVRRGGSLLLVADPQIREGKSRSSFNDVLRPTAMQVRYDTAVTRTGNWEQSYQVLSHPATAGLDDLRNHFGFELGSSIRTCWPARPVLVGRWGWSDPGSDAVSTGVSQYNAGELLGDLVLAAEQPLGRGRVFVLGNTSPLRNEVLANAYPFVGRLLGYLAHRPSSLQDFWRQLLGLATILALAVLLALRPAAWQLMLTSAVMSLSLVTVTAAGYWSGRVLPDGRMHAPNGPNNLAYIDASHLEACSSDLGTNRSIAGLLRTLMRHGYLPLMAPDLTAERLERAKLLISIAPAREFSFAQRETVKSFVDAGGTMICMVGAEDVRPNAPLLADFDLAVPPSPVPPGASDREPEPLGAEYARLGEGNRQFRFHAAWPVESTDTGTKKLVYIAGKNWAFVYSRSRGEGTFVVIGDTHFASNENFDMDQEAATLFWRWLLSRTVAGQEEWTPPAAGKGSPATGSPAKEEDDEDDSKE